MTNNLELNIFTYTGKENNKNLFLMFTNKNKDKIFFTELLKEPFKEDLNTQISFQSLLNKKFFVNPKKFFTTSSKDNFLNSCDFSLDKISLVDFDNSLSLLEIYSYVVSKKTQILYL
ncbi:Uncharacterised protein [Mycoplasmopsis citelli]|uniref:Uncharacterized protein n=1 Tax=Mycoplasmopsis citelli TaxID=171281 RepID=A0A449B2F4_9BACT|nr:hypothetical protein [Mycoplasmopsis citelli]VEU74789.1 Uncharacterised protein [Mycoplasmopsis citelli]